MNKRVSPVRPYNRFGTIKVDGSGRDPNAGFMHFIKKESTIDAYRTNKMGSIAMPLSDSPVPKGKVPYGTTKCTYKLGLSTDAKLDRYQMGIQTRTFPKNPTDIVGQEETKVKQSPFQGIFDKMISKPEFDRLGGTKDPWVAKVPKGMTINNRSSSDINIITG